MLTEPREQAYDINEILLLQTLKIDVLRHFARTTPQNIQVSMRVDNFHREKLVNIGSQKFMQ